jgi:hypothetical protein
MYVSKPTQLRAPYQHHQQTQNCIKPDALHVCVVSLSAATSSAPFQPWGKPGIVKDSTKSVFVRNLPFESTYEDLASFFSQAGEVGVLAAGSESLRTGYWC